MLASEYKKEVNRLEAELKVMSDYADKLADGLPEGMLPKDIEILRATNAELMQFYESVKKASDYCVTRSELENSIDIAIAEYEK